MPVTVNTPMPETVRRIEVITGDDRRRKWTDAQKASIVAECLLPGRTVSSVARAHAMSAAQLFGWRRQLRDRSLVGDVALAPTPAFVPAVVEARHGGTRKRQRASIMSSAMSPAGPCAKVNEGSLQRAAIIVKLGGALVRIGEGADASSISAVIAALRGKA